MAALKTVKQGPSHFPVLSRFSLGNTNRAIFGRKSFVSSLYGFNVRKWLYLINYIISYCCSLMTKHLVDRAWQTSHHRAWHFWSCDMLTHCCTYTVSYILLELMKDYTMKICCLQDNNIKLYNLTNIIPDIALTHFVVFSRLRVWVPQCSKTNSQSLKKPGVVPDFYFLIFLNIGASIRISQKKKEEEKKWQLTSDIWHLEREKPW